MKTILFKMSNGGVANYPPTPEVIALMMGSGYGWELKRINQEALKFIVPNVSGSWPGFSLEFATEWATAIGLGGLTEAEAIDLIRRRIQLRRGYTASALVEPDTLPHHLICMGDCAEDNCCGRYFRDAIVWDDGIDNKCTCDMDRCRGVHMDKIRIMRNAELAKKDTSFMRAVESGDTSAQTIIATEKQTLRDIPQTFDLTTENDSPEELKQKWPAGLPKDN